MRKVIITLFACTLGIGAFAQAKEKKPVNVPGKVAQATVDASQSVTVQSNVTTTVTSGGSIDALPLAAPAQQNNQVQKSDMSPAPGATDNKVHMPSDKPYPRHIRKIK